MKDTTVIKSEQIKTDRPKTRDSRFCNVRRTAFNSREFMRSKASFFDHTLDTRCGWRIAPPPPNLDTRHLWWLPEQAEEGQTATLREDERGKPTPCTKPWSLDSKEQACPESQSRERRTAGSEAEEVSSASCSRGLSPQSWRDGRNI